jgi:peptidoglycan/LPS O-acetylase OafA/YrhL
MQTCTVAVLIRLLTGSTRVTYRGLDSFRFFAFLAVFLYHVRLFPAGYLGVQAFFVLSGFLLTPILINMRYQLPARKYFLHFYGRRSLRIFPLYYAYLLAISAVAALALAQAGDHHPPAPRLEALQRFNDQAAYGFTYTYNFFHASREFTHTPLLTHFWSLAVEEQFYLVWPFLLFLVPNARLKGVLLVLIAAGPVVRLAEAALVTGEMHGLFLKRLDLVLYVLPFSHIDAFATGGFLAVYGRAPSRGLLAGYATVLVSTGMVAERLATGSNSMALGYGPFMADSWKYLWGYTCFNLLFGWILLMLRGRALAPALAEHPALVYLGRISYGLYVFHFGVIWLMSGMEISGEGLSGFYLWPTMWRAIYATGMLSVTILISMASYRWLEAPCLRLKDRFFPVETRTVPELRRADPMRLRGSS